MAQLAPWLAEPIDAGASFLKGAQAGSLIAATWARKEQLGLETARVGAALQEHALKMRAEEAELEYSLQQKAAGVELAQAFSRVADLEDGWANPEAPRAMARVGVKYPAIIGSAIWQLGQENTFKARTLKNQEAQLESMDELRKSQIYENKAQAELALAESTDMQLGVGGGRFAPDRISKLITGREQARAEGRMPDVAAFDAEIARARTQQTQADTRIGQAAARLGISAAELSLKLREAGVTIAPVDASAQPVADGSAAPVVTAPVLPVLTPVARPLTTANVTAAQASMRDLENSHAAVQRALQSVESTPEAFGPLGPVREALEVARTMLFPGQPAPISSARTTADSTAEDIIRGLKQDSQMSVFEKKQLDRIARITGMADTPDRAKAKLNVVAVGIAGKAIRDAKLRGVPPPAWAVRDIDAKADLTGYLEDDLVDAVNQGYITQQRGLEELRRRKQAGKE